MIPDAETLAVAWAKADTALDPLLHGRIATRLPKDWASPFLRVVMIEGDIETEADVGTAMLQWDAYAHAPAGDTPDYAAASLVARTLMRQAQLWAPGAIAGSFLYGFGAITGPKRVEETDTGWARYMVEMHASIR